MSNTPSPTQKGAADHAIAGVTAPNWGALRHSANEWADMAINGLQWLRNIVDGASDAKSALENMEGNLAHCRAVNDAPEVQFAIRAASAAEPAAHAGQLVSSFPSGSSFDHKTASAILANRPVCGDALRRFVATARWEHDARHSMSLMITDLRRELGIREAEIALLKEALLLAEGEGAACGERVVQVGSLDAPQWPIDPDVSADLAVAQGDALDAARLDWLDTDRCMRVFHLGANWYTRANYGRQCQKRANLRDAIDAARAQEGESHQEPQHG